MQATVRDVATYLSLSVMGCVHECGPLRPIVAKSAGGRTINRIAKDENPIQSIDFKQIFEELIERVSMGVDGF